MSTIAGVSRPERVDRLVELTRWPIAPEVWDELRPPGAPQTIDSIDTEVTT